MFTNIFTFVIIIFLYWNVKYKTPKKPIQNTQKTNTSKSAISPIMSKVYSTFACSWLLSKYLWILSHPHFVGLVMDIFLFFLISFFRFCNQGRLEIETRKTNRIRETVSRRRSQTSTVKHSRPIPNHLNGSRSSKIVDAHLRMSLARRAMRFPQNGKSLFEDAAHEPTGS